MRNLALPICLNKAEVVFVARPLRRAIEQQLENKIAHEIIRCGILNPHEKELVSRQASLNAPLRAPFHAELSALGTPDLQSSRIKNHRQLAATLDHVTQELHVQMTDAQFGDRREGVGKFCFVSGEKNTLRKG